MPKETNRESFVSSEGASIRPYKSVSSFYTIAFKHTHRPAIAGVHSGAIRAASFGFSEGARWCSGSSKDMKHPKVGLGSPPNP